jgi:hypothetical protein
MMLRGNLSTRPFYNERLVNLVIVLALVAGAALAVFSVTRLTTLWTQRATLAAKRDEAKAMTVSVKAATEREKKSVDNFTLLSLGAATQEANSLIDGRTFSWTVFFGLMENTLPRDVRLMAVAPREEKGVFRINMIVNAKTPEDLSTFLDALQATGSFYELLPTRQEPMDDGTWSATVQGGYVAPGAGKPKSGKSTAPADGPGGRP